MHPHIDSSYPVYSSALCWPNDQKLRDQISLPITLSLNPLEKPQEQASFPSNKINSFRCHSCKAFANYLCVIRSQHEYDCSICGCTNRVSIKLNKDAPEFISPIYSCMTTNPTHRQNEQKFAYRNYIFAFDLVGEPQKQYNFMHYAAETIKQFCKEVENGGHSPCKISIFAFNKAIYEYGINEEQEIEKIVNTHKQCVMSGSNIEIVIPQHVGKIQLILSDILEMFKSPVNNYLEDRDSSFLEMIENILVHYPTHCGKIFIFSGINAPPGNFESGIMEEPDEFQDNFTLNKKKCLPIKIQEALEKTQLSINFYLYGSNFINAMPLYVMSKTTNGELKSYLPTNYAQFYYQFSHALCEETSEMGTETILKVRNSTGLKLIGIFGQYRNFKGSNDQIELISCPSNRSYMFEFVIEGKVQQNFLNVQFSILWTDEYGRRIFKVVTHRNRISGDCKQIIKSVNYQHVNNSYLHAVLHNMDLNVKIRNLQLTLQERCRKHIKAIEKHEGSNSEAIKKASAYIIFTFFLMRHYIMNTRFSFQPIYDKYIQTKSRILTSDVSAIHNIWPAVYAVNDDIYRIADMRYEDLKLAAQSVVIDQGSYCYVYISDKEIREDYLVKTKIIGGKTVFDLICQEQKLLKTRQLLEDIKQQKICGYVEILLMESLQGACIFDEKGPLSYSNFLDKVTCE